MNARDEIIQHTNGGLDIFADLYPGARENAEGSKKPFRQGLNDKNPSCHMKKYDDEWKLINYGEDSKPISAIDCYMQENGIMNFKEAIYEIADKYHINIGLKADVNKPLRKEYTDANAAEKEGDFQYMERTLNAADADVWGQIPNILETLRKYNYKALAWYSKVFTEKDKVTGKPTSNLKKITVYSSENYPIYMHECGTFRKIYLPYEIDKSKRFFYDGVKPAKHVNGLKELIDYKNSNGKAGKVLICSGERDSMNAAALGYYPIWFNSETANTLTYELVKELHDYAYTIVNIPDIDETGLKVAYDIARRFNSIETLILPEKLKGIKDHRGNPRKDLRDYLEIWPSKYEFDEMLNNTMSSKFWLYNEKDDKFTISTINLLWFLKINGFYKYKDIIAQQTKYIRIHDYVVREYEGKEIRDFVRKELQNMNAGSAVIETYLNSKKCTAALFDDLDTINLNFEKATFDSRTFFFLNEAIKVTKNNIQIIRNKDIETYAWEKSITKHVFKRLNPCFILNDKGEIEFKHNNSNLFKVVIQTSRMFWRDEFETLCTGNEEEDNKYRIENKFNPCGSRLNEDQIQEQMKHIYNKCYALGYICHTYKMPSRARALWMMENKITEEGESSGGSGKSFLISALDKLGILNVVTLEGRDKKLTDNNHFMERVSSTTDLLIVDDANEELDFDRFYTMITNSITINPKSKTSFEISFKDAPNVVFTSNFAPPRLDGSTQRRLLPIVFSDYYHVKTADNDYLETRAIIDDFGNRDLMEHDYSEAEYNQDINFLIDCEQFYLAMAEQGIILYPPMENVYKRSQKKDMGDPFKDWADSFFIVDNQMEKFHKRSDLYETYCRYLGSKGKAKTVTNFMKAIRAFCSYYDYEINMPYLKGYKNGRILQTIEGKTYEMVYLHNPNTEISSVDIRSTKKEDKPQIVEQTLPLPDEEDDEKRPF